MRVMRARRGLLDGDSKLLLHDVVQLPLQLHFEGLCVCVCVLSDVVMKLRYHSVMTVSAHFHENCFSNIITNPNPNPNPNTNTNKYRTKK